jgi:MFS family permease
MGTVSILFSLLLVDRMGRRTLMLGGLFVICFSLLSLFFGFQYHSQNTSLCNFIVVVAFLLYLWFFSMTLGPVNWIYPAEILQPFFIPVVTVTHWATACVLITIFPVIREQAEDKNIPLMYFVFFIFGIINIIVCWTVMVETKGKAEV